MIKNKTTKLGELFYGSIITKPDNYAAGIL